MYTSLGAAAMLVALLVVMFYCARMLLPLVSPILRVLIILLVAIMALYVIVVLLGVVGIHRRIGVCAKLRSTSFLREWTWRRVARDRPRDPFRCLGLTECSPGEGLTFMRDAIRASGDRTSSAVELLIERLVPFEQRPPARPIIAPAGRRTETASFSPREAPWAFRTEAIPVKR